MFVKPDIAWIPCEEQTPKESGQYLVTGKGKYWTPRRKTDDLMCYGRGWKNGRTAKANKLSDKK